MPFKSRRRRREGVDEGGELGSEDDPGREVIDQVWPEPIAHEHEPDAAQLELKRERHRARVAQIEARLDLLRLRARHWSGERLVEEGRADLEWWEHPEADPYAVLGLIPGASLEEAAVARRRIARRCHPDRLGTWDGEDLEGDLAPRQMVAANAAYDRLRRALQPA